MLKPIFSSMKDQINTLDNFMTRIGKSFFEMVRTIIKYVKIFLSIAFKSSKYIFASFGLIFLLVFFFSKEKKGNLYVLLYFFIGYMLLILLLTIITIIIDIIKMTFSAISLFHQSTENDRPKRQRVYKAVAGVVKCIIILALIIVLFFILLTISFIYSIEIELYDIINELFRGKS